MKDASNTKSQLIEKISLLKKRIQELEQPESDRLSAEQAGKPANEPLSASEESLTERLRFETLLFDLSARFMATPFDQVDSEIDNALRQIMEFFQVVLCGLLEVHEDKAIVRVSHAVYDEGIEPVSGEINLVELYPWTYVRLMQGEHININGVEDYPEEALRDRESYAAMGTGSRLAIPVAVGGRILRIITIHQKHRYQTWPEEYIPRLRLLGEILVNALERRQGRLQLEEQLRFEMLLAEISGRFVNLPVDQVDSEILDAQRRVCECLGLDLSALWQWSMKTPRIVKLTHIYRPLGGPPLPEPMYAHEHFPWCQEQLEAGRIVAVSSINDVPAEAERDQEVWRHLGIKTTLTFPLSPGGGPTIGALSFNTMQQERTWPEPLIQRLQLVAQMFTNALARKRAEQALQENEEINRATFDQAAVGIAHVGTEGRWLRVNDKLCSIVGYPREELLHLTFQEITHPDDLENDLGYVRQVLSGEIKTYSMEKRYFRKDRSIVWANLTVSLARTIAGEPRYFISVVEDITERKEAEERLEERLRFERLLSGLSAKFVNISPDRVDSEIEYGLEQVIEFFRVDRCGLLRISPDKTSFTITHVASLNALPVPTGVELPRSVFPWIYEKLAERHEVLFIRSLDDLPAEAGTDRQSCIEWGIQSFVNIPILIGESVGHVININRAGSDRVWQEELILRLQLLGEIFVNALEIRELKLRLERENVYLQEEIKLLVEHTGIVGQSRAMRKVLAQAEQVARTDSTVLLQGETGTGKELLACAIHQMSARKNRPLVTVNCASLPPTLIESELFGRERGAYTGAMTKMVGRFEIADGSTIFLDEIGELPLELQSKLLRVIEEGSFERLGSTKPLHVNVRIIAASNRDIEQGVKDGTFRRDLFYRLNVFPIVVPPLRERPEDIPLMVWAFVNEFQKSMGKEIESVSRTTLEALQSCSWPGNVRELRNVIERAMILNSSKTLVIHMPRLESSKIQTNLDLEDMERRHIVGVLESTGWRVSGRGGAAEVLGLKRSTLISKMTKLGISRPAL